MTIIFGAISSWWPAVPWAGTTFDKRVLLIAGPFFQVEHVNHGSWVASFVWM